MLRRSRGAVAADGLSDRCLDAETIAAWIDGDLQAADVTAAEAHVSECARCQAMMAALVRTAPAVGARVPWWRRGWIVGSLVPLTAAAVALAIWIAAPNEARRAPADRPDVNAVNAVNAVPSVQPPPSAPAQQPPPPQIADRIQPPAARETRSTADRRLQRDAKVETTNEERRDQAAAKPAAPPPPAAASPAPLESARAATAEIAPMRASALSKEAFALNQIASPDPSVRWRIGPSGSIQRSTDGGATWEALTSGVTEDLTAGAAPSSTIVWIVGRSGAVLLSIDGRQWRRLAFPERVDLVAVRANDATIATVTTADGRTFRTADGGRTWSLLQEF